VAAKKEREPRHATKVDQNNSSDKLIDNAMTVLRRYPLVEQAAEALLARITSGEWPLGHRLPGETTLATELGVGRSTVREAVRELAGGGVLQSRQGSGVFVVSTTIVEDWETLLRRSDIGAVIEGRLAIEVEAARLAANRRTPTDLRILRELLRVRGGSALHGSDAEYVDADLAFHRAIVVAAHNPVFVDLFASFAPRLRQAMIEMLALEDARAEHRHDQDAHAAIVDAIAGRDPDRAAIASREHLGSVHGRVRDEHQGDRTGSRGRSA
jgi:DNA-binding FadR family transcriptional regulator